MRKMTTLMAAATMMFATGQSIAAEKLSIYHWFEYIPQELLNKFTAETGIEVVMDTYDSNEAMLANLKHAWAEVIEINPSVIEIESNPEYLTLPITEQPVIQLSFDIGFGEDTGSAHFVLPYAMLEPVSQKFGLAAEETSAAIRGEWADAISQQMRSAEVELRAELPSMKLTFQQLLDLMPGDVVPIKSPDDVVVKAGHVEVFQGKFGTAEGQNAVKITQSALSD